MMRTFLNRIAGEPDIAALPVMIDSSDFEVIEAGLRCVQGKAIVNSISLKEGEEVFRRQARTCRRFGAGVVVMAFDERGQAVTVDRRLEIYERAWRILVEEVGFAPADLIFDPNILTVATGMEEHDEYARDYLESLRRLRPLYPGGQAVGGREQRLLLLPRQRHRAPGHALGPALPRDPGGPGHGHRQRRPAGPVRGHPLRLARARGGRAAGPAVRRHGPPAGLRRGTEARGGPPPGARRGGLAPGAAGAAPGPRPAPRTHGVPRGGSRGGPGPLRRAPEDHRGAAHGRHEPRGRPLRGGQDVPAAGGQVGPGDEAGRGPPGALDGRPGTKRAKGPGAAHEDRDGHGPGRRPRHRQEHRRGRAALSQRRRRRPRGDGAGRAHPRHGPGRGGRPDRPQRA